MLIVYSGITEFLKTHMQPDLVARMGEKHTRHDIFIYVIFVLKFDASCSRKLCKQKSVTVGSLLRILCLISLTFAQPAKHLVP